MRKKGPRKRQPSKLDPYTKQLDHWFGIELRSLEYVQKQLAARGCNICTTRLSSWWKQRQLFLMDERLLDRITRAAQSSKAVRKRFAQDAAPDLDVLMMLHQVLIQELQKKGDTDHDLLRQADSMMRTVVEYFSDRNKTDLKRQKLGLEERRIMVLEKKAESYDRAQQALKSNGKKGLTRATIRKIERELRLL